MISAKNSPLFSIPSFRAVWTVIEKRTSDLAKPSVKNFCWRKRGDKRNWLPPSPPPSPMRSPSPRKAKRGPLEHRRRKGRKSEQSHKSSAVPARHPLADKSFAIELFNCRLHMRCVCVTDVTVRCWKTTSVNMCVRKRACLCVCAFSSIFVCANERVLLKVPLLRFSVKAPARCFQALCDMNNNLSILDLSNLAFGAQWAVNFVNIAANYLFLIWGQKNESVWVCEVRGNKTMWCEWIRYIPNCSLHANSKIILPSSSFSSTYLRISSFRLFSLRRFFASTFLCSCGLWRGRMFDEDRKETSNYMVAF